MCMGSTSPGPRPRVAVCVVHRFRRVMTSKCQAIIMSQIDRLQDQDIDVAPIDIVEVLLQQPIMAKVTKPRNLASYQFGSRLQLCRVYVVSGSTCVRGELLVLAFGGVDECKDWLTASLQG